MVFSIADELAALRSERASGQHGHRQKTLIKQGKRTVALFTFKQDARLAEHTANGHVTIHVLEGRLAISLDGQSHELDAGSLMAMEPGVPHDVHAMTDAAFVLHLSLQ